MFENIRTRKILRMTDRKRMPNPKPFMINYSSLTRGQVILEFTFCMVVVLLMVYGMTKVFTWTGREYVGRIQGHDETLYLEVPLSYNSIEYGPMQQIDPYYYTPVKLNAIWGEH